MKDVLEKFGLYDLFAYLCPGAIFLFSWLLWIDPTALVIADMKDGWTGFVVDAFLLLLAYALGLIVTTWGEEGTAQYLSWAARPGWPSGFWNKIEVCRVCLLHWVPQSVMTYAGPLKRAVVRNNLLIARHLNRAGLEGLSNLDRSAERFAVYRAIITGQAGDTGKGAVTEAEALHRRFLFAQGTALVCVLVGLQALVRLPATLLWRADLPYVPWYGLLVLSGLAFTGSFALRWAAGRWWEMEFLLTCSLARLTESNPSPAPAVAPPPVQGTVAPPRQGQQGAIP